MSNVDIYLKHPLITFWYLSFIRSNTHPTRQHSKKIWHNPNAHTIKYTNKWESAILTTYATMGKKCQCVLLQTHLYHVLMYLCKVDYMMANNKFSNIKMCSLPFHLWPKYSNFHGKYFKNINLYLMFIAYCSPLIC